MHKAMKFLKVLLVGVLGLLAGPSVWKMVFYVVTARIVLYYIYIHTAKP